MLLESNVIAGVIFHSMLFGFYDLKYYDFKGKLVLTENRSMALL